MMGSGKTTVGRLLAERTGREFIDLDALIESRVGKRIVEIFSDAGEEGFRDLETETLQDVAGATHTVIATGGGVVIRAENRRLLQNLGLVVWLDAPPDVLLKRIGDDESRPMLHGQNPLKRMERLLSERRGFYADASNIHLDTTELTPDEIATRVSQELGKRDNSDERIYSTIVAIDGPVGSGKSTLAGTLARQLGYTHIDTGAMYRCVAYEAIRKEIDLTDFGALTNLAHRMDIRFGSRPGDETAAEQTTFGQHVYLAGEDVTEAIRSPEVSRKTAVVAGVPGVRAELSQLQRELGLRGRAVLEGRDIGTVVVPEAMWKVYLVASLEERVQRRFSQYQQQGQQVDKDALQADILERDRQDRTRSQGALKLANDGMLFDTTDMPLDEVVATLKALIQDAPENVAK
jgi:cytidylate kinase